MDGGASTFTGVGTFASDLYVGGDLYINDDITLDTNLNILGIATIGTLDVTNKGKHLSAEEFNKLTDDPETILIDFRNHYEWEVGHFRGAITPDVDTFRESLPLIEEDYLRGNEDKNMFGWKISRTGRSSTYLLAPDFLLCCQ